MRLIFPKPTSFQEKVKKERLKGLKIEGELS